MPAIIIDLYIIERKVKCVVVFAYGSKDKYIQASKQVILAY